MNFNEFNFLDIFVLIIIGLSTIFAIFRGLIGSILSLTGWILSIYLSYATYPYVEGFLASKISNPIAIIAVGHGSLMACYLILFAIFNSFVSSLRLFGSQFLDCTLGGVFGFFRGFLIVSFIYLFLSIGLSFKYGTEDKDEAKVAPEWLTKAQTYNLLKAGKSILLSFIPNHFNNKLTTFYQNLTKTSKDDTFILYAKNIMLQSLPEEQRNHLKSVDAQDYLSKSQEEIDNHKLKLLLDYYKKNVNRANKPNGEPLSKEEIMRLERILNNNSSSSN